MIAGRELLEKFRRALTEEEQQIVDLRTADHSWEDIGARVGKTANAVRMQYSRALDRVTQELGLEV